MLACPVADISGYILQASNVNMMGLLQKCRSCHLLVRWTMSVQRASRAAHLALSAHTFPIFNNFIPLHQMSKPGLRLQQRSVSSAGPRMQRQRFTPCDRHTRMNWTQSGLRML